jgi:hypothetical protein
MSRIDQPSSQKRSRVGNIRQKFRRFFGNQYT